MDAITVNPHYGLAVGKEYMKLPAYDAAALPAYDAFIAETREQYRYLTRTLGIAVHVTLDDPYPDASAMMHDVGTNRRLAVLSSGATGGHPYMSLADNDIFRAVHDYFGHYANRFSFSRHGEESAYRAHRLMYSDAARPALATETRGQNSAFIFVNNGEQFPPQKIALLPAWATALY